MRIAVVGTGYVGLVTGTCFSEMGVHVTCVDVDENKINSLKQGLVPIYEPGLETLVHKNVRSGRLNFTTRLEDVLNDVDIVFSAVGTPPDEDGSADLKYVLEVAHTIGKFINHYIVVVTKSTVPVGTAKKVKAVIEEELTRRGAQIEFDVVSNPEFLKEGNAGKDFMSPDRVVVGVESDRARKLMARLCKTIMIVSDRLIFTDIPSAEMIKYAANSMLATRISFRNDSANQCELVGVDVNMVRKGNGSDTRIGKKFLYAGCGYGGSCFPKDVKALIKTAADSGYQMRVLQAVEDVNADQKLVLYRKLVAYYGNEEAIKGKKVAMWGLAFKPETDDMREAPSLVLIDLLTKAGATVKVYDPVAMDECRRRVGDVVSYAKDMYDAVDGADVLMLVTEWKEFRLPNTKTLLQKMNGRLILDGRNILDGDELHQAGFEYHCIGR